MEQIRLAGGRSKGSLKNRTVLSEQDIYAAGDSLEILRDAFDYFSERNEWLSTPQTLGELEKVYGKGTDAMCLLVSSHLKKAGQAVRPKRNLKKDTPTILPSEETAQEVSLLKLILRVSLPCNSHLSPLPFCFLHRPNRLVNVSQQHCKTVTCSSLLVNSKSTSPWKRVPFERFAHSLTASAVTVTIWAPCRNESLLDSRKYLGSLPTRCCGRKKLVRAVTPI